MSARTQVVSRDVFLRALLVTKLRSPLADLLYAFHASRTNFEAYQFKPVLKFLDAPVPGLLIADEVGLGKTIEAAILLQELRARGAMRRVLVICPAGLREKWQAELLNRFDEQFQVMYRREVQQDIRLYQRSGGTNPLNGIVSLESFRSEEIQGLLAEAGVTYNLVIIDEAHHLRTTGTLSNVVGERMQEMSEHLLLLTATPLQTSQQDLFNLLRFIDPGQFAQPDDFLLQLQPNALLNQAISCLRAAPPDLAGAKTALLAIRSLSAGTQVTSHPGYPLVLRALEQPDLDREALVRLRRDIDALNVISAVYTRTIKRDVSGAATRDAHAVNVPVTEAEALFLEAVLAHARAQAQQRSASGWTPGFTGIMRERQAASCITAMREYLEESIKARAAGAGQVSVQAEESSPELEEDANGSATFDVAASEQRLAAAAAALGATDSKFAAFLEALRGVLGENDHSKVIVFTFFRRTIAYLERQLRKEGVQVVVVNGDVKPDERARRIAAFQDSSTTRVLLTTEVGAEGLDFQFCDTMFNYDLPWNPMRVEQRIGRIDRYGQQSKRVRIFSFFLRGTIEERILGRLYDRIGIFEESIGELEPILGPIVSELTRDVFRLDLSPEEEAAVAERYAQMIVSRRQQERELEESSSRLLGRDVLLLEAIEDSVESGRYVSASELRALVSGYLEETVGQPLIDRASDGLTALVPSNARLVSLVEDHLQRAGDSRPGSAGFLRKLSDSTRVAATFDGEMANRRRQLEFLNQRHPLVQMAAAHYLDGAAAHQGPYPLTSLVVHAARLDVDGPWPEPGDYEFMLMLLSVEGAVKQMRLLPIAFERWSGRRAPDVEGRLLRLVQDLAVDGSDADVTVEERKHLEARALQAAAAVADQLEAEAIDRNEASIAVRRATLERTFQHRISKRRALLAEASDERIRRMRSGEIANLEADLRRRVEDLEAKRAVAVTTVPVGGGRLILGAPGATPYPTVDEHDGAVPAGIADTGEVEPYEEPPSAYGEWPR